MAKDWTNEAVEVRRGFGLFTMADLGDDEFVTASGLNDGGYIVWKLKTA